MTPLFNAPQIRRIEAHFLSQVPEGELIRRAAEALFIQARHMLAQMSPSARVLVLLGPGNNGADAKLCGQLLAQEAHTVDEMSLQELESLDRTSQEFQDFLATLTQQCLVIDGLFGIGLNRAIRTPLAKIFEAINVQACKVLAVDIPSGLEASTGMKLGAVLRADVSVTFLRDKTGLRTGEAAAYVGAIQVSDLACSIEPGDAIDKPAARLLSQAWLSSKIPYRSALAHKGTQGSVLIIGGAPGMRGAALLAALGAQAGGAGKVFLHFLRADPIETFALSMLHPSLLLFHPSRDWEQELKPFSAIVIGCGLGQSSEAKKLLKEITEVCEAQQKPLVLDADALNLMALHADLIQSPRSDAKLISNPKTLLPWVITPHPLEAARLLGITTAQVQADRIEAAQNLSKKLRCVVALKGPGTVITRPETPAEAADNNSITASIAPFGSPALAVGGTGDVLAGLIGSLLAQGFETELAAQAGTTIHALAGAIWSETRPKSYGLRAEDLAACIVTIINSP